MDPARKRTLRLVVALTAALLLATALVYTSFATATETKTPSDLHRQGGEAGKSYELTGKVAEGSWERNGQDNTFRIRDRAGDRSIPVRYSGTVPDPFREGREVIITVRKQGDTWVGERDSLITKCPSKFEDGKQSASS